jgi:hypothetical protein
MEDLYSTDEALRQGLSKVDTTSRQVRGHHKSQKHDEKRVYETNLFAFEIVVPIKEGMCVNC